MRTKLLLIFVIILLGFSNSLIAQCNAAGEEINLKNEQFLIGLASMPNAVIGSDGKLNIKSYPFTDRDWKGWKFELKDGNSYVEIVNNPVFLYNDGTTIKVGNNNSYETKRFREITYPLTSRAANNESVFVIKYINGFKTVQLSHSLDGDKVLGIKKSDLRNGAQFEWVSSKSKDYITEFIFYKRPDFITSVSDLDGHDDSYHFELLNNECKKIDYVEGTDPFIGEEKKYWQIKNINDSLYTISAYRKLLSVSSGSLKLNSENELSTDCIWKIYPTGDGSEFLIESFNSGGFLTWNTVGQATYQAKKANGGWHLRKKYLCCQDNKIFSSKSASNLMTKYVEKKVYASVLNDRQGIEDKIAEFNEAILEVYNDRLKATDELFNKSVYNIIKPGNAYYLTVFDPNRLDGKIQWDQTLERYLNKDWTGDRLLLYFDSYHSFRIYGYEAIYAKEKHLRSLTWKDFFARKDKNMNLYVGCYKPFSIDQQWNGYKIHVKATKCEDYDPIRKIFKVRFSDGSVNDVFDNGHFTSSNGILSPDRFQRNLRFGSNGITRIDSTVITGPYNNQRTQTFNACKLIYPTGGFIRSAEQQEMLDFSTINLFMNEEVKEMNRVKESLFPNKKGSLGLLDFVGTNGRRYFLIETTLVE